MTRKCSVEGCKSDSNRKEDAGVTFHKVPPHPDLRPKWLSLCRIPKNVKIIYVCSRHFLRADFCNFKGRKYMLKQGVLPSVFPWDKSKLEAIKADVQIKKEPDVFNEFPAKKAKTIKKEPTKSESEPSNCVEIDNDVEIKIEPSDIKEEISEEISNEIKSNFDEQLKIAQDSSTDISASNSMINFAIDSTVEVLDNHNWYFAKINEVDYDENEVLIHFETAPNKCDEWISMTSSRLRPVQEKASEPFQTDSKILEPMSETASIQPKTIEIGVTMVPQPTLSVNPEEKFNFEVGERVMAAWSDSRKFPATVNKRLDNGAYEVLFDDGYIKAVKPSRIAKVNPAKFDVKQSASPLFDPVSSTKQERREKKRKINVAELFTKRPKLSLTNDRRNKEGKESPSRAFSSPSLHSIDELGTGSPKSAMGSPKSVVASPKSALASPIMSPPRLLPEPVLMVTPNQNELEPYFKEETGKTSLASWRITWKNGVPVGEESQIETQDGFRKTYVVSDSRLPLGWAKHLCQRTSGSNTGKWDVIFVSPENKKFRSKNDIKNYLDLHPEMEAAITMFDFSSTGVKRRAGRPKTPKKSANKFEEEPPPILEKIGEVPKQETPKREHAPETGFNLKIVNDNGVYRCPLEGCGKQFRRENLALMHVKHYHAEYSKYLESMPNMADLAYARTVGESLDPSSPAVTPPPKVATAKIPSEKTPKPQTVATSEIQNDFQSIFTQSLEQPNDPDASAKETEIIRILNKALIEEAEMQQFSDIKKEIPKPDFNIKDLLSKPSEIPIKDEKYLRSLSSVTRTPTIKTLLPVRSPKKTEAKHDAFKPTLRSDVKLKLGNVEETPKKSQIFETTQVQGESTASSTVQEPTLLEPMEPIQTGYDGVIIENGKVIKLERMKQEEIINCLCGFTEEDGLMIQCELCLCWQHAYCNNIVKETEVPEKYICHICQNPLFERRSYKYLHDQEWLKHGVLPSTSFHTKNKEILNRRFEKLKKCHNISGGLLELREYHHTLGVKLLIAESKNHPKLYWWSKPWDKPKLPEKTDVKQEEGIENKPKLENGDHHYIKNDMEIDKTDLPNETILSLILKAGKDDGMLNIANNMGAIIPQAEAAIDTDDCRLNLLDHISHSSALIEERLDDFEKQLDELEREMDNPDLDQNSMRTKQTIQLLLRDLQRLHQFGEVPMA